jgi:type II secretory ATPase GspE/PulE/Tfp pilus assembly ATPase PilB-like protein
LSTLHTNDAPQTLQRLIDMKLEPYLIAETMSLVVAQRLLRKLCPRCKKEYTQSYEDLVWLKLDKAEQKKPFFKPVGCQACRKTGYKGRTGVYEVMPITTVLRQAIGQAKNSDDLRLQASTEGMKSMYECGVLKVQNGITDASELRRHVIRI